jgi:hypothetical protein
MPLLAASALITDCVQEYRAEKRDRIKALDEPA